MKVLMQVTLQLMENGQIAFPGPPANIAERTALVGFLFQAATVAMQMQPTDAIIIPNGNPLPELRKDRK
jgi:hypothetical protein